MTSLCKWLAADAGIVPELGTRILDLGDELAARPVDAVIHTAPVPQALATMAFGGLLPGIELAQQLTGIHYKPTIAVMVAPAVAPTGLADHGGSQHNDDPNHPDLAFVADNQAKGISPVPAVTIHLSNATSAELWSSPDEVVLERALTAAATHLGPAADRNGLHGVQIQRWRYAGPVECWPEPTVVVGIGPRHRAAGEAFAGPKVEGAFLSGGPPPRRCWPRRNQAPARRHDSGTVTPGVDLRPDLVGVFTETRRALPSVMTAPSMRTGFRTA